jgi:hypothetical protein
MIDTKDKILKEFEEKFGARLASLEMAYQVHGGDSWSGQSIPEFISQAVDKVVEEHLSEIWKMSMALYNRSVETSGVTKSNHESLCKINQYCAKNLSKPKLK